MRRRKRAARGPVGGMGGSFILDVILHLEIKHVKNKSWVYGSAMGVRVGKWNVNFGQTVEGIDGSGYAVLRGHQDRAGNTVNELLTHYTSSRIHRKASSLVLIAAKA